MEGTNHVKSMQRGAFHTKGEQVKTAESRGDGTCLKKKKKTKKKTVSQVDTLPQHLSPDTGLEDSHQKRLDDPERRLLNTDI